MRLFASRLSRKIHNALWRKHSGSGNGIRGSKRPVVISTALAGAAMLSVVYPPRQEYWDEQEQHDKSQNRSDLLSISSIRHSPLKAVADVYSNARKSLERRWERDGGSAVIALTAANVGVYLLWKTAPTSFMVRGRVWTSFTSNFSHMGILHLGSNMYLLDRFGPDVADILGSARFCVFYATSGIASSLASLTFRRFTRSNVLSLGASGSVVAILWLYACFFPDRRMTIIGTNQSFTMQELVLAYAVIDAAGLLGSLGKIDFAAHLGGAAFSNIWFYAVRDQLVREELSRQYEASQRFFKSFLREDDSRNHD